MIRPPSTVREKWLGRDFELIDAVAHTGNGVVDLWEASPVRLGSNEANTGEVIDLLFPGNPLLCCGWTRHRFDTRPRTQWYKLRDLQFIVPSPMTATFMRYLPWRKRSTAATSARRMPGSSAEWPASGTIDKRAEGHAAASSKAVRGGQIMS